MSGAGARPSVARCSFLVLGEDSAADAHDTLVALAKKILRLVDSYYDPQHVRFEPPRRPGRAAPPGEPGEEHAICGIRRPSRSHRLHRDQAARRRADVRALSYRRRRTLGDGCVLVAVHAVAWGGAGHGRRRRRAVHARARPTRECGRESRGPPRGRPRPHGARGRDLGRAGARRRGDRAQGSRRFPLSATATASASPAAPSASPSAAASPAPASASPTAASPTTESIAVAASVAAAPAPAVAVRRLTVAAVAAEPVVTVEPTLIAVSHWGRLEEGELFAWSRRLAWAGRSSGRTCVHGRRFTLAGAERRRPKPSEA